eukprot:scaffold7478_cov124-Isochrysis_galbana.AAC.2
MGKRKGRGSGRDSSGGTIKGPLTGVVAQLVTGDRRPPRALPRGGAAAHRDRSRSTTTTQLDLNYNHNYSYNFYDAVINKHVRAHGDKDTRVCARSMCASSYASIRRDVFA